MEKTIFDMSPEELSEHLLELMAKKFDNNKEGTRTATKYSDLTLHGSVASKNPNERVTVNGNKHVSTIDEDDHLISLGDITETSETEG